MQRDKNKKQLPPELERYLEICHRIYLRMKRDNTWPWVSDSTDDEDLVDSEGNPNDV